MQGDAGVSNHSRELPLPLCGQLSEASTELGISRVDQHVVARLWVGQRDEAGIGQVVLTRIDELHGDNIVPAGQEGQRPLPPWRRHKVGRDDHEGSLARHPTSSSQEGTKVGRPSRCRRRGREEFASDPQHLVAPLTWRHGPIDVVAVEDGTDSVAAAGQ